MPKIVIIKWIDVMSIDAGLLTKSDITDLEPSEAYIVGYLVKQNRDNYYIAKEWWETGQFKYLHIVPKRSVLKLTEIDYESSKLL